MATETRGNWGNLIKGVGVDIADVFDQGQEEYQPGIGAVLRMLGGSGAQETYSGKTGAGTLGRFDEGDDMPGGRRYKSYETTVAYNNYGEFVTATRNLIEDRNFSGLLDEMKDLSIAANYSQDQSGMQIFNGGFATTIDVNGWRMTWYGDGVPLFSTIHPTVVPGASTQSNASATGIIFSGDNLEVALVALIEQQTDDGEAMALLGKPMLVLPPALKKEGLEVTQSTLEPGTANNAINVYKQGMGTDMVMSTFLANSNGGSDTAWSVIIPGRARLNHHVRRGAGLASDVSIKNENVTYTVSARWADSVTDWRRTWGSQGDLAAYSS